MLHRLAPLALVFAACSREVPDYSACRLVGRWQVDSSAILIRLFERAGWATKVRWPNIERLELLRA